MRTAYYLEAVHVDINDPHFLLRRLGERGVVEDPENVTWQGTPRFCM